MKPKTIFAILSRRQWIKVFLFGTVTSTALAGGRRARSAPIARARRTPATLAARQPFLAELVPSTNNSGILPIQIGNFPALDEAGGSISLYFSTDSFPIIINRGENDQFYALDPRCTHQSCPVGNYEPQFSYMRCFCHGSTFDIQGRVTGGPAQSDLAAYRTEYDGNGLLKIELPNVPLRIDSVTLQSKTAQSTRLKLQFPGTSGCKYRVQYYSDLTAPPQATLFATTAGGVANQSFILVPYNSTGTKTLWVDAPGAQGFFTIELMLGLGGPP